MSGQQIGGPTETFMHKRSCECEGKSIIFTVFKILDFRILIFDFGELLAIMAEELQVKMQTKVCQAPEGKLQALAKDFKLDIAEQRKSRIVSMIFNHIDK